MAAAAFQCLDEDEVLGFVGGDLDAARRNEVLAHVDGCESCRTLAAQLAREHEGESESADDTPPKADSLVPGALVAGRFRVGEALGRGAMGTVFKAHDEKLGIDVALKILKRGTGDRRGFAREHSAGRSIADVNVCRFLDAGTTADFDYITMELIDGETLAALLDRETLPLQRSIEVLSGIVSGLAAAHERGIVHRDLKPANVMIERATGRPVISDFGFATNLDAKQSRRLVGTPAYWPPEQARGEPASPASDVYSFGVMAYRLLAGCDFTVSDPDALDRVPRRFRRAVGRCVELAPGERFRSGKEAQAAFRSAARGPSRGRPIAIVLAATAIVALVALASKRSPTPAAPETPTTLVSSEPSELAPALLPPLPSAAPSPAPSAEPAHALASVSKPASSPRAVATSTAHAAASSSSPAPTSAPSSCTPPYTLDERGRKHFKRECFQK